MTNSMTAVASDLTIVLIDVQPHFLLPLGDAEPLLVRLEQLLITARWFDLPVITTVEEPVNLKGELPTRLAERLPANTQQFTKQSYDLCRETKICKALTKLGRRQIAVAGGETDVCVLQSVLALASADFTVFLLEDCLFSSEQRVEAARRRMDQAGAIPSTYKTLFYELVGGEQSELWRRREDLAKLGWLPPESLPSCRWG